MFGFVCDNEKVRRVHNECLFVKVKLKLVDLQNVNT